MRRDVPLALLVLWACLLVLAVFVHPGAGERYEGVLPFVTSRGSGIDYYQFWMVGRARDRIRPANIYSDVDRDRMAGLGRSLVQEASRPSGRLATSVKARPSLETFSTPFLYATIGALAAGDYDRDLDRYIDVCLACLVLSVIALGWLLRYSLVESLLFCVVLVFWSEPLSTDLRVGNVNELQLASLALYLLLRAVSGRTWADVAAGAVLGFLVAFKPTLALVPALLAWTWAVDRRWRTIVVQGASAIAAAVVAFVAGCLFLGSWGAWLDWRSALSGLERVSNVSVAIGNYSLARAVREGSGADVALPLLGSLTAFSGFVLYRTRQVTPPADRRSTFQRDFAPTALGCALSVVALRLVWLHYYVLLIPLSLYALRPRGEREHGPGWREVMEVTVGWLALLAVLGRPLLTLLGTRSAAGTAAIYIVGAWLLMLLGLWHLWSSVVPRTDAFRATRPLPDSRPAHLTRERA